MKKTLIILALISPTFAETHDSVELASFQNANHSTKTKVTVLVHADPPEHIRHRHCKTIEKTSGVPIGKWEGRY